MISPRRVLIAFVTGVAATLALSAPTWAQQPAPRATPTPAAAAQPQSLGQFGDWGAYSATPGGRKVCYALSKPTTSKTDPPNRPRDQPYMFVSTRPAEKVQNEVSIIIGYPFKPNSEATVEVAGTNFSMYTQQDGAWIKNAAEEARMIETMRRGAELVVKGTSGRGTLTTDVFSLRGLAQALDRIAQECK